MDAGRECRGVKAPLDCEVWYFLIVSRKMFFSFSFRVIKMKFYHCWSTALETCFWPPTPEKSTIGPPWKNPFDAHTLHPWPYFWQPAIKGTVHDAQKNSRVHSLWRARAIPGARRRWWKRTVCSCWSGNACCSTGSRWAWTPTTPCSRSWSRSPAPRSWTPPTTSLPLTWPYRTLVRLSEFALAW